MADAIPKKARMITTVQTKRVSFSGKMLIAIRVVLVSLIHLSSFRDRFPLKK